MAVLLVGASTAEGQMRGGVKTDEADVTIVIGGELALDAVFLNKFFRADGRSNPGFLFAAARFKLDFDFRLGADSGIFASLATSRRESHADFGQAYPRTRGALLGQDNLSIDIDELFFETQRLFNWDLTVRAGQSHILLGLDTQEEKLWEGHGRLFFDTDRGRGPVDQFDRMRPVGLQVRYKPDTEIAFTAYLSWLHRFFLSDDQTTFIAAGEASISIDRAYSITAGYMRIFDQAGPDMEAIWVYTNLEISPTVQVFGEAVFQLGNGHSGKGAYGGVRVTFDDASGFVETSAWILTGDDPDTPTKFEGFRSFGSIRTTIIVDSVEYGLGRQTNLTAVKFVGVYRLTYNLLARIVYARYASEKSATDPRPGDEINVWIVFEPDLHTRIQAGVGYLFTSRIHGPTGNPDGWAFMVALTADF